MSTESLIPIHHQGRVLVLTSEQEYQEIKSLLSFHTPTPPGEENSKSSPPSHFPYFTFDQAGSGEEALSKIKEACLEEDPYSLVIMEIDMGKKNQSFSFHREFMNADPRLHVIILHSLENELWEHVALHFRKRFSVLFQQRPYKPIELQQCALVLFDRRKRDFQEFNNDDALNEHNRLLKEKIQYEQNNERRNDLISRVSHEIKTPLNAILSVHTLLEDTKLDEEQKEFVDIAQKSGKSLLDLLNNMLEFFRNDAGHGKTEKIDFEPKDFFKDLIDMFKAKANSSEVTLVGSVSEELPQRAKVDAIKLKVIMTNLIDNAIKFSKGGEVSVNITPEGPLNEEEGVQYIRCTVSDSGIGIPKDQLDSVFSQYAQVDGSQSHLGSGVGLNTSFQYAGMMGGALRVDSSVNVGSSFYLIVPLTVEKD